MWKAASCGRSWRRSRATSEPVGSAHREDVRRSCRPGNADTRRSMGLAQIGPCQRVYSAMLSQLFRSWRFRIFIVIYCVMACSACAFLLRLKTDVVGEDPMISIEYRGLDLTPEIGTIWGRDIRTIREKHSCGIRCVVTYGGESGNPFITTNSDGQVLIEGVCATDTLSMPSGAGAFADFSRVESAKSYSPCGKRIAEVVAGDGVVKLCMEAGHTMWETRYEHGRISLERRYHQNSVLASESSWRSGKPHGLHRCWDEQGRLTEEGRYVDGERAGTWKIYDESGAVIDEDEWW